MPLVPKQPALDLSEALKGASNDTPLIFVLSSGADPMSSLLALAKAEDTDLRVVSLGQGQGVIAEAQIEAAAAAG